MNFLFAFSTLSGPKVQYIQHNYSHGRIYLISKLVFLIWRWMSGDTGNNKTAVRSLGKEKPELRQSFFINNLEREM